MIVDVNFGFGNGCCSRETVSGAVCDGGNAEIRKQNMVMSDLTISYPRNNGLRLKYQVGTKYIYVNLPYHKDVEPSCKEKYMFVEKWASKV